MAAFTVAPSAAHCVIIELEGRIGCDLGRPEIRQAEAECERGTFDIGTGYGAGDKLKRRWPINIKCWKCGSKLKLPKDYSEDGFDSVLICERDDCGEHTRVVIKDGHLLRCERVPIIKRLFLRRWF